MRSRMHPRDRSKPQGLTAAHIVGAMLLLAVLALTLGANLPRPQLIEEQDKLEHVLAFLALAVLFGWNASAVGLCVYALGLCCAAVGIEVAQAELSPGRTAGAMDAIAGMIGVFGGLAVSMLLRRMRGAWRLTLGVARTA